jgi:protein SCO1/2
VSWAGTVLGAGLSLALVTAAFAWATDGFTVLTAEQARQRRVALESPPLPPLAIESPRGPAGDWAEVLRADGRSTVLHFVYTSCRTLCSIQSMQTRELQRQIEAQGLGEQIRLVTVSFDPQRDTLQELERYAQRFEADPAQWSMWRPRRVDELRSALAALGIVVIPDAYGEFVHNAAWLVVDRQARLRAIVPQARPLRALRLARELAG